MNKEGAEPTSAEAAADPAPQPLNILDAVCVLYFTASGQLSLLVEILAAANYKILLPTEVLKEVRDKAKRQRWNIGALDRYLHQGADVRIIEIPEISAAQTEAAILLAQVRSRHPNVVDGRTAASSSADLGECVVVTHGILAHRRGLAAVVAIDDLKGQTLARRHQVTCFTIEDAFSLALEHGLLDTLSARKAYEKLRRYGDSLPTWEAELKSRLKRERAARKRAASATNAPTGGDASESSDR
ncbi:hypothetical protein [Kribbella catacumbae]|uniref:hypothetical protein n=1 Tax=Kribbella catacumbae TaxID=460086 RepID=UPI000369B090|nr:hypothetical protein [Kribbella catacumbae]